MSSTEQKDHGWLAIKRELARLNKMELVVGVLDSSVAEYAVHNEFGAPKANVPERSFIRSTMAEHKKDITKNVSKIRDSVMSGKNAYSNVEKLGLHIQGLIQKTIRSGVEPENKKATKARKGHDRTLVGGNKKGYAGGKLMGSITFAIR